MNVSNNLTTILTPLPSLTKEEFEIVVTRYNESLDWLKPYEHLATVYNKGKDSCGIKSEIFLQNFGRGTEVMLRHIVNNYDKLAKVTFFSQGQLADRSDQPLYPLTYYAQTPIDGVRGYAVEAWDLGKSRFRERLSGADCVSIGNKTLAQWRNDVVGISYQPYKEKWVRGDWIAIGRDRVHRFPNSFYHKLYDATSFYRGESIEEMWFWERTFWSLFTRDLDTPNPRA